MKTKFLALSMVLTAVLTGNALAAMTGEQYKAEKTRISSEYKAKKQKCDSLKANAKDICMAEAKGADKIALAEAEAQYKPSVKHTQDVAMAKADAAYNTAKEKCDDQTGNAKDVCIKAAKAAQVKAREDFKVAKVAAQGSAAGSANMADTKKEANDEKREANYKVAKERCDALSGTKKDTCENDAKVKFGMK